MARGKLLTIFVVCCVTGIHGDSEESLLNAGQGCGESGKLFILQLHIDRNNHSYYFVDNLIIWEIET